MESLFVGIIEKKLKGYSFGYSIDSGCPFPRSANKTTAIAIATPAAAPNAAIPASAIKQLVQN